MNIGHHRWAIAEGYLPEGSTGEGPELASHETLCVLNTGERDAELAITVYFSDREPVGPYRALVPARRTHHLRFNDLRNPEPIPVGVDFASLIEASEPIVVQHTRLDSRQAALGIMTTLAFPC